MLDAGLLGHMTKLDTDLEQSLEMVRSKGDGHDEHILYALGRKLLDRVGRRRRQPFQWADLRLVAQTVIMSDPAAAHDRLNSLLDMARVRIALIHELHRRAV